MPRRKSIATVFSSRKLMEAALRRGVRDALIKHQQAGLPAVEWRDGKIVWVPPEELGKAIKALDAKGH